MKNNQTSNVSLMDERKPPDDLMKPVEEKILEETVQTAVKMVTRNVNQPAKRRDFIKHLAGLVGTLIVGDILGSCSSSPTEPAPCGCNSQCPCQTHCGCNTQCICHGNTCCDRSTPCHAELPLGCHCNCDCMY